MVEGMENVVRGMPRTTLAGDLGRGAPAKAGVRPDGVVVVLLGGQHGPGMGQRGEQRLVETLLAQSAVEALHERVLGRLARNDIVPFYLPLL